MRFLILATAAAAVALPASAASAQSWGGNYGYGGNNARQIERQCQRALRNADSRREYFVIQRDCQRRIAWAQRAAYNRNDNRYDNRYDNRNDRYRDRNDNDGRYWDGYRWRNR